GPREGLGTNRVGDRMITGGAAARLSRPGEKAPRDAVHTRLARWAISRPKSTKRLLMLAADAFMLPLALWMAISLRQGVAIDPVRDASVLLWAAGGGLALFSLFGLYRSVTRFIGVRVVGRIAVAIALCAVGLALIHS